MADLESISKSLVDREESKRTLVRFEDATDELVPRLRYSIPLPGSYEGRMYLETDFGDLPWDSKVFEGKATTPKIKEATRTGGLAEQIRENPKAVLEFFASQKVRPPRPPEPGPLAPTIRPVTLERSATPVPFIPKVADIEGRQFLDFQGYKIAIPEIEMEAENGRALVVYERFGEQLAHTYVEEAQSKKTINPRFIIVEHYRLSSHFGNYGAGRTVQTFSLWPGEETTLYIRSWRRTEQKFKEASSIFDSYTQEAAEDFQTSLEAENSYRTSYQKTNQWKASGGFGLNLGLFKIGGGGGGGGSSISARETLAKTVSKVSTHHASKASSKRETSISTELEITEAQEFETIIERHVHNANLSRVLNLVCRELNQEFTTYLSLYDVSIAFVNDLNVYDEAPLYDIDSLIERYVKEAWDGNPPASVPHNQNPRVYVKQLIRQQIDTVFDFQGNAMKFMEDAADPQGQKYWRVRRRSDPDAPHPFYPTGKIPVEGIVLDASRHSVRTDALIIDSLLGHGVALDNYALGTQQEVLRERQLKNKKTEFALKLIESGDANKIEAFRSLFVCCADDVIKKIGDYFSLQKEGQSEKEEES